MPIARSGQFYESTDSVIGSAIGIESNQLVACLSEIKKRKIRSVFGAPCFGFHEENLDFLADIPDQIQIWFWDAMIKNIDGLYALTGLKYFGCSKRTAGIDFSRLTLLEQLVWHYNKNDKNIKFLKKVAAMDIWHFNPRERTFHGIEIPSSVKKLSINWANPETLDGIPVLPSLTEIEFHYCKNLTTIERLDFIAPNLEKIVVSTSGKCCEVGVISAIKSLKHAWINGKIDLDE